MTLLTSLALSSILQKACDAGVATAVVATSIDAPPVFAGEVHIVVPVASVTKALFSYAIMIAIEEGIMDLGYTTRVNGPTVRQLLSHASGLGFGRLDRTSEPERRRLYSNYGFEVLGEMLENQSSMSVEEYVREAVFDPLAMHNSSLAGSPAKDALSSAHDLGQFARELLEPTLIHPTTFRQFTQPQYASLEGFVPGIGFFRPNPWGLGVEIKGQKAPHWTGSRNSAETFGHFGGNGSFLWVDPAFQVSVVLTHSRPFARWALDAWPILSDAVLDAERGIQ